MIRPCDLEWNEYDPALPGFRFLPTDEELVTFYLRRKLERRRFPFDIIMDVDIYKYDPWELPKMVPPEEPKRELYFFCPRIRKYRPNRITSSGFWKATGTDRPVNSSSGKCVGLKKSLVFYRGRAARAVKTDWMMHEFRLPDPDEKPPNYFNHAVRKTQQEQKDSNWTICKIFKRKSSPGKNQVTWGQVEQCNQSRKKLYLAHSDINSPAANPLLSEASHTDDFSEEDSRSLSLASSNSAPRNSSASLYAASDPLNHVRADDEHDFAPPIQSVESESSTSFSRITLPKLQLTNISAISGIGLSAGEDVWNSLPSALVSPDAGQANAETQPFGTDCWASVLWSPTSCSIPLWDQPYLFN